MCAFHQIAFLKSCSEQELLILLLCVFVVSVHVWE